MKGLLYQLKSVRKDKFCIMSFFLPVVVAIALKFAGGIDLSSLGELQFGVVADDISPEAERWLMRYGPVTAHQTRDELVSAIHEPSTNQIGVEMDGNGIKTIVSGDEWAIIQQAAGTLPALYGQREMAARTSVQVLERPDILGGYQYIFVALTLIVAMFMGCIFNAMNIISEKEDGVALINEILPMSPKEYIIQKIFVGFAFGCLSAIVTACICFQLSLQGSLFMLALIILSAFAAALIGLFIGKFSENLMVGVAYVKVVMIVFLAVPLASYLLGAKGLASILCYLVPSSATFEAVMELAGNARPMMIAKDMLILMAHGMAWFLLYLLIAKWQKKRS